MVIESDLKDFSLDNYLANTLFFFRRWFNIKEIKDTYEHSG